MVKELHIREQQCKGCYLCIEVCPKGLLAIGTGINIVGCYPVELTDETECNGCGLCATVCPDYVLQIS